MKLPCYVCNQEMIIDESDGEGYHTDGLIIKRDDAGNIISIDESNKKIRHETCVGD